MINRPALRRMSQFAAAGAVSLVAACSPDQSFTAPEDGGAVLSAADAVAAVQAGPPEFVPGEVLVKFRDGATVASRGRALGRAGGESVEEIFTGAMKAQGRKVGVNRIKVKGDVASAIAALRADADVEYAEPNWVYKHQVVSNDPYFTNGSLWGMSANNNAFGSGAATAWARNGECNGVYVGIIDEGYMFDHEDLSANAGVNPGEGSAANGVDDDGNGLIDDIRGWDFAGGNNSVFDGTGDDHGTHVAGTIAGVGGNGIGVSGVCQSGIKLLSAKFLGSQGGTTANAIKAVDYFTDLKVKQGLNIVATNNSWGGGGFSQALKDAIDRAGAQEILFVAAAGNSGTNNDATASYPSGYTSANIIAVASITSTGALSSFSQYGANSVDIGAPGSSIWSTVPTQTRRNQPITSGYASYSGTSMATPHVTGGVALYAAHNPGKTAAQIKAAIQAAAVPTPSLSGKVLWNGRLNVSTF